MTREQLRSRYLAAMNRHWRTSIDRSGPTPDLLDDLAGIADKHAMEHAEKVTARKELRAEAAVPVPVAAEAAPGGGGGENAPDLVVTASTPDSHRTRTRPRRTTG